MTDNLDLLLRFLLDTQSVNQVNAGTEHIESELLKVDKVAKELDKTFAHMEKQLKGSLGNKELDELEQQLKDVEEQVKDTTQAYRLQARVLKAEAAAITDDFAKARLSQINSINEQIGGASRFALGAGVGIVGGAIALASKYVKDAKEATAVTRAWKEEQESLEKSGQRFGSVLAQEALPLLQKAANLAERASRFVEQNPEVIRAALNTGVALATLGAVGVAVSKGIKIYTDLATIALGAQQLAAAKLQDIAADKQLIAAKLKAGLNGVPVGGAAGASAGAGAAGAGASAGATAASVAGVILLSGTIALSLAYGFGKLVEALTGVKLPVVKFIEYIGKLKDELLGKAGLTSGRSMAGRGTDASSVAASPQMENILKAYEDYKNDDLALVKKHYEDRDKITQDALADELAENKKYASEVSKINTSTTKALTGAARDFEKANAKAEEDYVRERARIISDGNEEIAKIEEDSKKRLAQMAEEHGERVAQLTAARDALGLAKENRQFKKDTAEERSNTKAEIRQRREDIALRLADLKNSYEQERAQRLEDYQARVSEIRANAAERLKELAAQHIEEMQRIREQRNLKIKEIDQQFAEERKRRYQYFIQQVRDMDASLLGERTLKIKYQQVMLKDLDVFLLAYRTKLASLSKTTTGTTGSRATGGYAGYGVYRLGDDLGGNPGGVEYVLTNRTVQAAENIIGGKLTQESIIAALSGRGGQGSTLNYSGRFSGEYTSAMRRQVRSDVQSAFRELLPS